MTGATALGDLTWPDAEALADRILVVPLGSTEQHGPHLPLDTDTRIAQAVAARLADVRADCVVAPALPFGSSGEHQDFPGTISIGTDALATVLCEIGRSALPPAGRFGAVVFVSGHGGNRDALARATETLRHEGRSIAAWSPSIPGGDAHAGRSETSLMLAIDPDAVKLERIEAGQTAPLNELLPLLRRDGLRPHAPNGVLGDPAGATATEGTVLLEQLVADLHGVVDAVTS